VEFCHRFEGYKVTKTFRVKSKIDLNKVLKYRTFAYLFDTFIRSKSGGTGKKFDWRLMKNLRNKISRPVFLSGGLTDKNVKKAVRLLNPDWVDVSSSTEASPGKKDYKKLRNFIDAVNSR
jgi:phosphoribosylanthranilate isomerase